jgi:glycosyltransferase involved in cell wall biosynthesis
MIVAGFTFIRNAVKYDYPIVEAIGSILPVCDYVVVAVGNSDDETLAMIQAIDTDKIRIIETIWDDSLRAGGKVLAEETNKAFDAIGVDADWCFYIQGDEVLHEDYHGVIRAEMERWLSDSSVEGLLFKYRHFYGSYDYVGDASLWYRREIRIVRNDKSIRSYKDAQGFRKQGHKLQVKLIDAYMHHYGWVRHPDSMMQKQLNVNKFWHDDKWVSEHIEVLGGFDYSEVESVVRYEGTHPQVIQKRIDRVNWTFATDPSRQSKSLKDRVLKWVEKKTGVRIGEYKNYRIV